MIETLTRVIRVVIADDTADLRVLIRLALQLSGGFEVVGEAGDGRAALEAVLRHRPDAVLLDLAMPVMDGLQAIPLLRQRVPGCSIVVLSGFEAGRMAEQALRHGADAYLTKGTSPSRIAATLRSVVENRRAEPVPDRDTDLLRLLAHELLNSLTVIGGYATTLRMAAKSGSVELAAQCADVIERHAAQMEAVIRNSQDARHIEAGTMELKAQPVDLEAAVGDVVADLSHALEGHRVVVDARPGSTAVADPLRLRQMITNLLTNAAKFSPGGTTVTVSVTPGTVRVHDEGPGIPAEQREAVFEKFGRLDHKVPGSGLGLYVARGVARAHGGDLRVVDATDGATFELTLPGR